MLHESRATWAGFAIILLALVGWSWPSFFSDKNEAGQHEMLPDIPGDGPFPGDFMWRQRAYPRGEINAEAYYKTLADARSQRKQLRSKNAVAWDFAGPTNIPGRVPAVAMAKDGTVFAGAAAGGIWKGDPSDQSWLPLFDEIGIMSIGAIALAPSDESIIYAGTGEANGGGGSVAYNGQGVFKSVDGGSNWRSMGLNDTAQIGRILVHPQNPDIVYVAAMGRLFAENPARGLYRSNDGGETWENILFISNTTGVIDAAMDPSDPNRIYAVTWQRIRFADGRDYGGPECAVYRSSDGGENWERLSAGLPDGSDIGRMGIDISESNPNIVVVTAADRSGDFLGVFRSTDRGNNFTNIAKPNLDSAYSTFGWWFGQVRVHPTNPDNIYVLGIDLWITWNGGTTWVEYHSYLEQLLGRPLSPSERVHVDHHDMVFHPDNPNQIALANDGGVYYSTQDLPVFSSVRGLQSTQFYTVEIHPENPSRLYGGTQDNGTMRTDTGAFDSFYRILPGDGFRVIVPPNAPEDFYAESQFGNLWHWRNGQWFSGRVNIPDGERFNWSSPLTLDPSNPDIVYFGSQRIWRTETGVENFTAFSPDLTDGPGPGNITYGTLTTIEAAASDGNVVYAGTDDGNVWTTRDGGETWIDISEGLPDRWITWVTVDPRDALTAYVSISGARWDEPLPHLFKTTNGGESWLAIDDTMPDVPVNKVLLDPRNPDWIHVATDVGVMTSSNQGASWQWLGVELPPTPIIDIDIHPESGTMAAATYGRGLFTLDLNAALYDQTPDPAGFDFIYAVPEIGPDATGSSIIIVNPSQETVDIEIAGFGTYGENRGSLQDLINIGPMSRMTIDPHQPFQTGVVWIRIAASAQLHVFTELADGETRSAYWTEALGTQGAIVPHVAQDTAGFETAITAVNGAPSGMTLTVKGNGSDDSGFWHNQYHGHGQDSRTLDRLFGADLTGIEYATIEASRPNFAAMESFTTLPNRSRQAALGLNNQSGTRLHFLHVAADNQQFWTGLVYLNTSETTLDATEIYLDTTGLELGRRDVPGLEPGAKVVHLLDQNGSATLPANTARVVVEASHPITGYELFGSTTTTDNDFFAGLQGVYTASAGLDYPFFQASTDRWLGIVAVNLGNEQADATFTLYDSNGNAIATTTEPGIQPGQKITRIGGSLFPSETWPDGAWIRMNATGSEWSGFLLWGDQSGTNRRHMAGLLAAPVQP